MGVVAGEGCRGAEGFCRHSAARKWTGSALRQARESQAGNLVPDKDNCREGRLEKVRYGCPLAAILASDGRLAGSHHYAPVCARERASSDALEAKRACNVAFIMTFRVANLQNRTLLPAAFRERPRQHSTTGSHEREAWKSSSDIKTNFQVIEIATIFNNGKVVSLSRICCLRRAFDACQTPGMSEVLCKRFL